MKHSDVNTHEHIVAHIQEQGTLTVEIEGRLIHQTINKWGIYEKAGKFSENIMKLVKKSTLLELVRV